jgi:hypothetical protein
MLYSYPILVLNASAPHASGVLFYPEHDATYGVVPFPAMGGVVAIEVIKFNSYITAHYSCVLHGGLVGIIRTVNVNANKPLAYCYPEVGLATDQEAW